MGSSVRLSRAPSEETKSKWEMVHLPEVPGGPRAVLPPHLKNSMTVRRNGLSIKSKKLVRLPGLPPELMTSPTFDQVLRFSNQASNPSFQPCTVGYLANACGGIAATTTLFYPWASSIRIKSIHIWPSATEVSGAVVPVATELRWAASAASGYTPEDVKDSTLPGGITVTRPGKYGPPKGSLANEWLGTVLAADNLFSILSPAGTIVDVHVLVRMSNTLAPFPSAVIVGGTAGLSYWGHMDGAQYLPLGRPNISGI